MVEATYIGYRFEVADRDLRLYNRHTLDYRRRARRTSLDECVHLAHEWLQIFGDPHIGALRFLSDSTRTARGWPVSLGHRDPEAVRQSLAARADRLDPIEGVWYTGNQEVAVVESDDLSGLFLAVVLADHNALGEAGAVIGRFERGTENGTYDVRGAGPLANERFASVHRNALLLIGQTRLGRRFPATAHDNPLNPVDPLSPMIVRLDDVTMLVTIPSHQYAYGAILDSLVTAHHDELLAAEYLLIDVRGNTGGSSLTTDPLRPFYLSSSMEPNPFDGPSPILTSTLTREYYEAREAWGSAYANASALLKAAELGDVIRDPSTDFPEREPVSLHATPRAVGVLIDWANLSAVDVFLLEAKRSDRVTLFGEATNSAVDYLSVSNTWLSGPPECEGERFLLYYPTSAAPWMPEGGVNATGIEPDVRLDGPQSEWVQRTLDLLRSNNPVGND